MGVDIRLPNITATSTEGRVSQLQSYMYQMVQQLNWALNTINSAESGDTSNVVINESGGEITPDEAQNTFNSIKSLIIKSADIVTAYEETIKESLNGEYVAKSDFGTYTEQTDASIEKNSKGITEAFTNIQTIDDELRTTESFIKRGLLYYDDEGNAVYGVEIGETKNGEFFKYAMFVSDQLTFYDSNNNEVAHIGSRQDGERTDCLYITGAASFLGDVQFGGYKIDTSDGLAFTWIGG